MGGGGEIERDRQNPKQAQRCSTVPDTGYKLQNYEVMTCAEIKGQMLN